LVATGTEAAAAPATSAAPSAEPAQAAGVPQEQNTSAIAAGETEHDLSAFQRTSHASVGSLRSSHGRSCSWDSSGMLADWGGSASERSSLASTLDLILSEGAPSPRATTDGGSDILASGSSPAKRLSSSHLTPFQHSHSGGAVFQDSRASSTRVSPNNPQSTLAGPRGSSTRGSASQHRVRFAEAVEMESSSAPGTAAGSPPVGAVGRQPFPGLAGAVALGLRPPGSAVWSAPGAAATAPSLSHSMSLDGGFRGVLSPRPSAWTLAGFNIPAASTAAGAVARATGRGLPDAPSAPAGKQTHACPCTSWCLAWGFGMQSCTVHASLLQQVADPAGVPLVPPPLSCTPS
jgi:hypothetical protein